MSGEILPAARPLAQLWTALSCAAMRSAAVREGSVAVLEALTRSVESSAFLGGKAAEPVAPDLVENPVSLCAEILSVYLIFVIQDLEASSFHGRS